MLDDALVRRDQHLQGKGEHRVSILVVLDDALVLVMVWHFLDRVTSVSILVVLDDALVLEKQRLY